MKDVQTREAYVSERFDLLHARFKQDVAVDDYRYQALVRRLEPLEGRRILDLGCGKGRFARRLQESGAIVMGIDLSHRMLNEAEGFDRVRGSGRRLPFAKAKFDSVIAVDVFQHLPAVDEVIGEADRVLRPGGLLLIIDKNASSWNDRRPYLPNVAVKWVDERRGLWMYSADSPVRERWFLPETLRRTLSRRFKQVEVEHLLSPSEQGRAALPICASRQTHDALGGVALAGRDRMSNIVPKGMNLPILPLLLWRTPPGLELILAQEGVAYKKIQHFHPLSLQAGRFVLFDSRQVPTARIRSSLSSEHVGIDVDLLRSNEPVDPFRALVDLKAGLAQWTISGLTLTERIGRFAKAQIRQRMVDRLRGVVTASGGTWATVFFFPFRSALRSICGSTSTKPRWRTTPASPTHGDDLPTVRPILSARGPTVASPTSCRICSGTTRNRTVITTSSTATRPRIERTSSEPMRSSASLAFGLQDSRLRTAAGTAASMMSWRSLDIITRRNFSLAMTTFPSIPGSAIGSQGSCRCRSTRSARGSSWKLEHRTVGASPNIW